MRVIDGGASGGHGGGGGQGHGGGRKRRPAWDDYLRRKKVGDRFVIEPCVANVKAVICHAPEWQNVIGLDEMSGKIMARGPTPWDLPGITYPRQWTDEDDTELGAWFSMHPDWYVVVKTMTAFEAVRIAARSQPFHPVRDYLRSVRWDGVPRLDTWCTKYLGVPESDYARLVGRMWLISAVARVMRPGCKADHVLILEGNQGEGKSSAVGALFGGPPWFMDTAINIGSKDAMQALRGRWCIEMGELDSLIRANRDTAKAFFSSSVDTYRPSHGRVTLDYPRQCVFVGTVNPGATGYLDDETGARRYWPVQTGLLDLRAIVADRDQIWAEAVHEYDDGRPWWPDVTMRGSLAEEQGDRYRGDIWQGDIEEWLESEEAKGKLVARGGISAPEILTGALGGTDKIRWGRAEQTRVGAIMHRLGWTTRRVGARGNRTRLYVRDDVPE